MEICDLIQMHLRFILYGMATFKKITKPCMPIYLEGPPIILESTDNFKRLQCQLNPKEQQLGRHKKRKWCSKKHYFKINQVKTSQIVQMTEDSHILQQF